MKLSISALLALLLASCTVKTDQQIIQDLWSVWEKSEVLSQDDFPGAVPLLLVHGWNGGEFTWPVPERLIALEQKLQRDIILFTYRTGILANRYPPIEVLEEQLDRYLAPYPEVDVVAHSMGGLLVRQYLSHHNNHPVRRVVFLATPHFGTNIAKVLVSLGSIGAEGNIQATEIKPGSDFLWQLNALSGSELDGIDVLNVYSAEKTILETDLVVSPSSAHLPWVHNAVLKGNHQALAKRFDESAEVVDFLASGLLPPAQPAPAIRDAWLRFKMDGAITELSDANFKSFSSRGLPNRNYDLCCKRRSGLHSRAGFFTVILEDLEADNYYAFMPYGGKKPLLIKASELMRSEEPVSMRLFDLDVSDNPAKEGEGVLQPAAGMP
ncbi:alpha/beta fold hydrolase [Mariprofundus aestuarium]|nr:alpha/beta fold hydrolase [Mariprofundus aestuarium]